MIGDPTLELDTLRQELVALRARWVKAGQWASHMQAALLPRASDLAPYFEETFVLHRPIHTIGGDFWWLAPASEGRVFLAVGDCSGVGTEGALLATATMAQLHRLAIELPEVGAARLLAELNRRFCQGLVCRVSGVAQCDLDALEIALVSYDPRKRELEFAGASRSIYCFLGGELHVQRGDHHPVGGTSWFRKDVSYTPHLIKFEPQDTFYLFTNGYAAQFGGVEDTKLGFLRFREVLTGVQSERMPQQEEAIRRVLTDWQGEKPSTDDLCILGLRIR